MSLFFPYFPSVRRVRRKILFSILLSNSLLSAQSEVGSMDIHDLDPLIVSASIVPRNSTELLNPATVVAGNALTMRQASTLGDTLDGQPGMHASTFGAGSSRPVIRGFDGARIRIMESGVGMGDLSAGSADHAVGVEPLFAQRIEVLRGPATLLFGSSAIGGVVNVVDRRIPRQPSDQSWLAEGMLEYTSVNDGWMGGAFVESSIDEVTWVASFLERQLKDYSIPGRAELDAMEETDIHEEEEGSGVLRNSFSNVQAASFGASWFPSEQTRLSIAWMDTSNQYGVPGHAHGHEEEAHEDFNEEAHEEDEGVWIDLSQTSLDIEMEQDLLGTWFDSVEARFRYTDYSHLEMEGNTIGTAFENELVEARGSALYSLDGDNHGSLGVQASYQDTTAEGEEVLTPPSQTTDLALFLVQEWMLPQIRVESGFRSELRETRTRDRHKYGDWAHSFSIGAHSSFNPFWSIGLLLNHSQRHPSATELNADGPHAATRQFQIGNPDLGMETARGVDLSLQFASAQFDASLTAFVTDYRNFIYAAPTGEIIDAFPVFAFESTNARFQGLEFKGIWHLFHSQSRFLDCLFIADTLKTVTESSVGQLPRIPPTRATLQFIYGEAHWRLQSSLRYVFAQRDTATYESATPDYTDWSIGFLMHLPHGQANWRLLLSMENLLDQDMRNHLSPIKDVAPLPGRSLRLSLLLSF